MKNQQPKGNPAVQGNPTSDRAFTDQREAVKQRGISNGGSQTPNQTSNRDNLRKQENKK